MNNLKLIGIIGTILFLCFVAYDQYYFEKNHYDDYVDIQNDITRLTKEMEKTQKKLTDFKKSRNDLPQYFSGGYHDSLFISTEKTIERCEKDIQLKKKEAEEILSHANYAWAWKWSVKTD